MILSKKKITTTYVVFGILLTILLLTYGYWLSFDFSGPGIVQYILLILLGATVPVAGIDGLLSPVESRVKMLYRTMLYSTAATVICALGSLVFREGELSEFFLRKYSYIYLACFITVFGPLTFFINSYGKK